MASRLLVPFAGEEMLLLPALKRFPSLVTADSEIPTYMLLANAFMPWHKTTKIRPDRGLHHAFPTAQHSRRHH